jgi:hypothetical protein
MQLNSSRVIGLCFLVAACGPSESQAPSPPPPYQPVLSIEYRAPAAVRVGTVSEAGYVWMQTYRDPSFTIIRVGTGLSTGWFTFAVGGEPTAGTYTLKEAVSPTGAAWYRADAPADNPEFGMYGWDPFRSRAPGTAVLTLTEVSSWAIHGTLQFAEKKTLDATF